ncbi:hypothetical protein [Aspergillus fumigatus polymycovirus 1]|nr:hypothetical protein [Aspergillus fumigatus polymycovirus 1]
MSGLTAVSLSELESVVTMGPPNPRIASWSRSVSQLSSEGLVEDPWALPAGSPSPHDGTADSVTSVWPSTARGTPVPLAADAPSTISGATRASRSTARPARSSLAAAIPLPLSTSTLSTRSSTPSNTPSTPSRRTSSRGPPRSPSPATTVTPADSVSSAGSRSTRGTVFTEPRSASTNTVSDLSEETIDKIATRVANMSLSRVRGVRSTVTVVDGPYAGTHVTRVYPGHNVVVMPRGASAQVVHEDGSPARAVTRREARRTVPHALPRGDIKSLPSLLGPVAVRGGEVVGFLRPKRRT